MKPWLKSPVHFSWFIAFFSCGLIFGVILCLFVGSAFSDSAWVVIVVSLLFIALQRRYRAMLVLCLIAGIVCGLWRGGLVRQISEAYRNFYGQNVNVQGYVSQDTSFGPRGDQRLRLSDVQVDNKQMGGEIWVSLDTKEMIKRGDIVEIRGQLLEGFGGMSAAMFKASLLTVLHPHPGDVARQARDRFTSGVRLGIASPEADLGIGYLVGQRSALPEDLEKQIRVVGLTHVVVASGYNLTILVVFARRFLVQLSKYLATLSGGLMIVGFILVTGLSPSMSRAGLVASISLLAWYYGRRVHPYVLLLFAAAVTLMIRPAYAWGDIGWYLSFMAFIGVIIFAPLIHHYFWGNKKRPGLARALIVDTLSAQLLTLPIILFAFGLFPTYALIANILVLPLVPFAMLGTFLAGVAGLLNSGFGAFVGFLPSQLLKYMINIVEAISHLPHAQYEIRFSKVLLAISYLAIIMTMLFLLRKTRHNWREEKNLLPDV